MSWKHLLFEQKLLMSNKKNWLLGFALILFFPLYYLHYSDINNQDIQDILEIKKSESDVYFDIFNFFPEENRDTPKGEEIYNNLTEQASLVNKQRFALWKGEVNHDEYIDGGLELNELRLRVHELGNEGIFEPYIVPKLEIYKENALLKYYKEHDLPLVKDPFVASNYLPAALNGISGLLFSLFVLLIGSSMYIHDQQKRTVMGVFPVTFMRKLMNKVSIHFVQTMVFLLMGVLVGGAFVAVKTGWGNFKSPVLLFQGGEYLAVSTTRYLVYMFIALALITLLLLLATAFLNIMTKNMYTSLLTILLIIVLPTILDFAGLPTRWLQAIQFIDIGPVMSGDAALAMESDTLDFKHGVVWLAGLNVILLAALYVKNRLTYRRRSEIPAVEGGVDSK